MVSRETRFICKQSESSHPAGAGVLQPEPDRRRFSPAAQEVVPREVSNHVVIRGRVGCGALYCPFPCTFLKILGVPWCPMHDGSRSVSRDNFIIIPV